MTTGNQGKECSGQGGGQKEWKEPCVRSLSTCVRGRQETCLNQKKKKERRGKKKSHINSFHFKKDAGRWERIQKSTGVMGVVAGSDHMQHIYHSSISINQLSPHVSHLQWEGQKFLGGVKGHVICMFNLQLKKNQQPFGRQRSCLSRIGH